MVGIVGWQNVSTRTKYEPFSLGDIRCKENINLWSGRYVDDLLLGTSKSWSPTFACHIYMVVGHTPARGFAVK